MKAELGIMQGRLLPPEGGKIQSFPEKKWRHEFQLAQKCGLDRIEWIIDEPNWRENPLMTVEGREEIAELSRISGVGVCSLQADLFTTYPLHSASPEDQRFREHLLESVIDAAGSSGLEHIDIPFVDASAINSNEAFETVVTVFRRAAPMATRCGLALCIKSSVKPAQLKELLSRVDSPNVKINYDLGSYAQMACPPAELFAAIGQSIGCVHIKDQKTGGEPVPLGSGDVDFQATFEQLRKVNYRGNFILQASRGGEEVEWTKKNMALARRCIDSLEEKTELGSIP